MLLKINKIISDKDFEAICYTCNETILTNVFYNQNILEQMFKFLTINELLSMRLVCSIWKSESERILKLRPTLVVLRTEEDVKCVSDMMDKQISTGGTPLFNKFAILLENIYLEQASFQKFITSHGLSIEQLNLKFDWSLPHTQNTLQSFKHLLEQQVPNLKSLQFFGFSEELWESKDLFADSVNLLPKLKHIGCLTLRNYRHKWECPLFLSLFNSLPSVKKITINCSDYWNILFNEVVSNNNSSLRKFFAEVEEICMEFRDNSALLSMFFHEVPQSFNAVAILKLMPQVCPKVRILRLFFDSETVTNTNVATLIQKYADQLEELEISATGASYHDGEGQPNVEVEAFNPLKEAAISEFFSAPTFPKLRVIHAGINIFQPPSTVTQLFHKQLPMLECASFKFEVPKLALFHGLRHIRLHTLEMLCNKSNVNCLLSIGRAFPNISKIRISLMHLQNADSTLEFVTNAFPNLEELDLRSSTNKISSDGIKCLGKLKYLQLLRIDSDLTEPTISWLQQLNPLIFFKFWKCKYTEYCFFNWIRDRINDKFSENGCCAPVQKDNCYFVRR